MESYDDLAGDDSELSQVPDIYILDCTYAAASKLLSIVREEVQASNCVTIRAAGESSKIQYRVPLTSEDRPGDGINIAATPSARLGASETANLQDSVAEDANSATIIAVMSIQHDDPAAIVAEQPGRESRTEANVNQLVAEEKTMDTFIVNADSTEANVSDNPIGFGAREHLASHVAVVEAADDFDDDEHASDSQSDSDYEIEPQASTGNKDSAIEVDEHAIPLNGMGLDEEREESE